MLTSPRRGRSPARPSCARLPAKVSFTGARRWARTSCNRRPQTHPLELVTIRPPSSIRREPGRRRARCVMSVRKRRHVCISLQRLYVTIHRRPFMDVSLATRALKVGNPSIATATSGL